MTPRELIAMLERLNPDVKVDVAIQNRRDNKSSNVLLVQGSNIINLTPEDDQ